MCLSNDINISLGVRRELPNKVVNKSIQFIFDFKNIDLMDEIISQNDTIVNCTGVVDKNLIRKCISYNKNYIDPSSNKEIEKLFEKNKFDYSSNLLIHSVGCNPGLTEIILKYIDKKYRPSELELYFCGNGNMSISALKELIETSQDMHSISSAYINMKRIEKLSEFCIHKKLPYPVKDVLCVPVITNNFFEVVKQTNLEKCFFYNTFNDERILIALLDAINYTNKKKNTESKFQELKRFFSEIQNANEKKYTIYFCRMKIGNQNKNIVFQSNNDWNKLTALVIVNTIKLIQSNKNLINNRGGIWNIFDSESFVKKILIETHL